MERLGSSGVRTSPQDRASFRAEQTQSLTAPEAAAPTHSPPTLGWFVIARTQSQVRTRCAESPDATPWQFLQLRLEGRRLQSTLCVVVYACVRSFHD